MKLLDAVNLILPKLGEHPITSLDKKHPTLAIILPEIQNTLRVVLGRGWWFNTFDYTAYPDSEKHIFLGVDTLSFTSYDVPSALRGNQLFNPETMTFDWDAPVKGCIKELVEFDLLPETAAQFVFSSTLVSVYATDIGLTNEVQLWQQQAQVASSDLLAEHLRNQKYSTANTRRFRKLRAAMRS